jgi:hypothetical protein
MQTDAWMGNKGLEEEQEDDEEEEDDKFHTST